MIGLAFSAASAIAGLVSSNMKDREIINKEKIYTPDTSSFQSAGLFNNAVGDIGEQTVVNKEYEHNKMKTGLALGSSLLGVAGSIADAQSAKKTGG